MASEPLDSTCAVCGKQCRQRRCSRCRKVNYCSVTCQRADWDAGHKSKCNASAAPQQQLSPQAAWGELHQTLMQMSPQQAHQQFQMAQDEIKRLEEEEKKRSKEMQEEPKKSHRSMDVVAEKKPSGAVKQIDSAFSLPPTEKFIEVESVAMNGDQTPRRDWIYVVEEMPNISSYQVTLWPKKTQGDALPDPNDLMVSMQQSSKGNTMVTLCLNDNIIFSAQFPGRLVAAQESANVVQRQSDCLSLRLQSRDVFEDASSDSITTSLAAVRSICCRYCDQAILAETQGIQKVLPLPKGYWDEVTDYLICYNGQPAVDFSSASTSAQEHLAYEDSAVIVLHCNNVGNGICVLAVEGYGEESGDAGDPDENNDSAVFRGPRAWRETVGGASLCCSQCCAVLGFASLASPETFRLLKHRLSAKNDMDWKRLHSCASFVAHEIVRYAESKAIYTFVVSVRSEGAINQHPKCILLKLLSWDTRQAKSKDSTSLEEADLLNFKPVVKVIYEVTSDLNAMHDNDDPMNWTWGGVDLCCLPEGTRVQQTQANTAEGTKMPSAASVRLWLSQEEWNELHRALVESSKYFSKAVTDATILVKLGPRKEEHSDDTVGLSALPLL